MRSSESFRRLLSFGNIGKIANKAKQPNQRTRSIDAHSQHSGCQVGVRTGEDFETMMRELVEAYQRTYTRGATPVASVERVVALALGVAAEIVDQEGHKAAMLEQWGLSQFFEVWLWVITEQLRAPDDQNGERRGHGWRHMLYLLESALELCTTGSFSAARQLEWRRRKRTPWDDLTARSATPTHAATPSGSIVEKEWEGQALSPPHSPQSKDPRISFELPVSPLSLDPSLHLHGEPVGEVDTMSAMSHDEGDWLECRDLAADVQLYLLGHRSSSNRGLSRLLSGLARVCFRSAAAAAAFLQFCARLAGVFMRSGDDVIGELYETGLAEVLLLCEANPHNMRLLHHAHSVPFLVDWLSGGARPEVRTTWKLPQRDAERNPPPVPAERRPLLLQLLSALVCYDCPPPLASMLSPLRALLPEELATSGVGNMSFANNSSFDSNVNNTNTQPNNNSFNNSFAAQSSQSSQAFLPPSISNLNPSAPYGAATEGGASAVEGFVLCQDWLANVGAALPLLQVLCEAASAPAISDYFWLDGAECRFNLGPFEKFPSATRGYTFGCWFNLTAVPGEEATLISLCDNNGGWFALVIREVNGKRFLAIKHKPKSRAATECVVLQDAPLPLSGWHHLVLEHGKQLVCVWVDGVEVHKSGANKQSTYPKEKNLMIYVGCHPGEEDEGEGAIAGQQPNPTGFFYGCISTPYLLEGHVAHRDVQRWCLAFPSHSEFLALGLTQTQLLAVHTREQTETRHTSPSQLKDSVLSVFNRDAVQPQHTATGHIQIHEVSPAACSLPESETVVGILNALTIAPYLSLSTDHSIHHTNHVHIQHHVRHHDGEGTQHESRGAEAGDTAERRMPSVQPGFASLSLSVPTFGGRHGHHRQRAADIQREMFPIRSRLAAFLRPTVGDLDDQSGLPGEALRVSLMLLLHNLLQANPRCNQAFHAREGWHHIASALIAVPATLHSLKILLAMCSSGLVVHGMPALGGPNLGTETREDLAFVMDVLHVMDSSEVSKALPVISNMLQIPENASVWRRGPGLLSLLLLMYRPDASFSVEVVNAVQKMCRDGEACDILFSFILFTEPPTEGAEIGEIEEAHEAPDGERINAYEEGGDISLQGSPLPQTLVSRELNPEGRLRWWNFKVELASMAYDVLRSNPAIMDYIIEKSQKENDAQKYMLLFGLLTQPMEALRAIGIKIAALLLHYSPTKFQRTFMANGGFNAMLAALGRRHATVQTYSALFKLALDSVHPTTDLQKTGRGVPPPAAVGGRHPHMRRSMSQSSISSDVSTGSNDASMLGGKEGKRHGVLVHPLAIKLVLDLLAHNLRHISLVLTDQIQPFEDDYDIDTLRRDRSSVDLADRDDADGAAMHTTSAHSHHHGHSPTPPFAHPAPTTATTAKRAARAMRESVQVLHYIDKMLDFGDNALVLQGKDGGDNYTGWLDWLAGLQDAMKKCASALAFAGESYNEEPISPCTTNRSARSITSEEGSARERDRQTTFNSVLRKLCLVDLSRKEKCTLIRLREMTDVPEFQRFVLGIIVQHFIAHRQLDKVDYVNILKNLEHLLREIEEHVQLKVSLAAGIIEMLGVLAMKNGNEVRTRMRSTKLFDSRDRVAQWLLCCELTEESIAPWENLGLQCFRESHGVLILLAKMHDATPDLKVRVVRILRQMSPSADATDNRQHFARFVEDNEVLEELLTQRTLLTNAEGKKYEKEGRTAAEFISWYFSDQMAPRREAVQAKLASLYRPIEQRNKEAEEKRARAQGKRIKNRKADQEKDFAALTASLRKHDENFTKYQRNALQALEKNR